MKAPKKTPRVRVEVLKCRQCNKYGLSVNGTLVAGPDCGIWVTLNEFSVGADRLAAALKEKP